MSAARWVATYVYVGGTTGHAVVFAADAPAAFRYAAGLGMAKGAASVSVALESATHNIPRLDPAAWARAEAALLDVRNRIHKCTNA